MKAATRMKLLGVVAGVAAAVAVASPAQALSNYGGVEAAWTGNRYPAAGNGGVFAFNRNENASGDNFPGKLVGGAPTGDFIGICLEIGENVTRNYLTYTIRDLKDAPQRTPNTTMGDTRADDVARLVTLAFGGYLANALTAGQTNVLAFQIALWEISTDRANGPYSLATNGTGGAFTANNPNISAGMLPAVVSSALTQANTWLGILNNSNNGTGLARNLFAMTRGVIGEEQAQDMLVQVVPIPAAAWLLGSGLLGLFGIARRRRTVAA